MWTKENLIPSLITGAPPAPSVLPSGGKEGLGGGDVGHGCNSRVRPQGGTQQLSQGLAERLGSESVRLGQAVTAIWQVQYTDSSLWEWEDQTGR